MDDISSLIREAKPLYVARKRRNNVIKSTLALAAVLWVGVLAYYPNTTQSYDYYWDSYFTSDNTTSVIEEMGLPTDEYGLLMIG